MKKWKVYGTTVVHVCVTAEAETAEDAIDHACLELPSLSEFSGNDGTDKLIGVRGRDQSVEASGEIDWTSAEEITE